MSVAQVLDGSVATTAPSQQAVGLTHTGWGRALALTLVLGFGVAAALPLVAADGDVAQVIIGLSIPLLVVTTLFATGLAIESRPKVALTLILSVPWIGGIYGAALFALAGRGVGWSGLVVLIGGGTLSAVLRRSA
jgi:hypothetical protein